MTEEQSKERESEHGPGEETPEPGTKTTPADSIETGANGLDEIGNGTSGDFEREVATLKEQLLRKAADFENYKKRTGTEIQTIVRLANQDLVLAILPIVDDLERSLKMGKSAEDVASFHKGVEMIYQKLQKVLDTHGVTAFETAGKPFDVHYHDALMQIPKADVTPDIILEEIEKGYTMNGKVIRHAKVVVSAPPADGSGESTDEDSKDMSA